MPELAVHTAVHYEVLVPSYLNFVRQHRGRRTTHQLENALGRLFRWLTTGGITELRQLTPGVLRDYLSSLHPFRGVPTFPWVASTERPPAPCDHPPVLAGVKAS